MEKINWLDIFEKLNIEEKERTESYITTTLEQKKNYFSKASFSLTIQYLRNFKRETHLLSNIRKIEYINSLNISPPKVGNTESSLFNQTVFEAQQNYYEFINSYNEVLINKAQLQDNISIYDLSPEEFYNHSKNEFINHKLFFSETQFQTDQLERLELLAEKYRNGIKNNTPVKITQNQFIKIKQYIQYFETLKQTKKKRFKLERGHIISLLSLFVAIIVMLWGNNIIGRYNEKDSSITHDPSTIKKESSQKKDSVFHKPNSLYKRADSTQNISEERKLKKSSTSTGNLESKNQTKDSLTKEEIPIIKSPNGSIITYNQSGGTNTVINNNVDLPKPNITFLNWSVRNQKVAEIVKSPRRFIREGNKVKVDAINVKSQYNIDSLYFNQIDFLYESEISRNVTCILTKRNDILIGYLSIEKGLLNYSYGYTNENEFAYQIEQPSNGRYTMKLYSKEKIRDPKEIISNNNLQ